MRLQDFPRPRDDNGRGVCWSAATVHPTGAALAFWLAELQAMRIRWVTLLDDGGGSSLELCRELRRAGMMPIVRLYRPTPNPGRLSEQAAETVARLVAVGVRYLETDSRPADGPDTVAGNFIADAERVLALGGLPALPALPPSDAQQALATIVRRGRRDLFERGAWLAMHSAGANRPLNYPYDAVNQQGQPLTPEEYAARLADEAQPESPSFAWDGEPLDAINRQRAEGARPGATVRDDAGGFLAHLLYHEAAQQELGFAVPVIATAGGPLVGDRTDRRYPRTTPQLHAEQVARLYRFMQQQAPPWFFAICPWLLANGKMGNADPAWEPAAWFGDHHNDRFGLNGALPVVATLKALPTRARIPARGTGRITGTLRTITGTVVADLPLTLRRDDGDMQTALSDFTGGFRFTHLLPATYALLTGDLTLQESIALADDETRTLPVQLGDGQRARLAGRVVDTLGNLRSGVTVQLLQADAVAAEQATDAQGGYEFSRLGAGVYALSTDGVRVDDLALDGWNRVEVDLMVAAQPSDRAAPPHASRLEGHVRGGREGQRLTLHGGQQRWTSTLNPAARFAFTHLPAGTYTLALDGAGILADGIALDGTNTVDLSLTVPPPAEERTATGGYVLLSPAEPAALRATLLLLLPLLRQHGLVAGFSVTEAVQMPSVIVVGDGVGEAAERMLQAAGKPVERWPGDVYQLTDFLQHLDRGAP